MIPKTTGPPLDALSEQQPNIQQPNIQQLAEQGWIHLDNLEKVALCPFARLDDYQRLAEQLAAVQEVQRRLCHILTNGAGGSQALFEALDICNAFCNELGDGLDAAAEGYRPALLEPAPLLAVVAIPKLTKKEKAGI